MHLRKAASFAVAVVLSGSCGGSPTSPKVPTFVVDVGGERFMLRLTSPSAIQAAKDRIAGLNNRFPQGPLLSGDGGFNSPWTWHLDPDKTQLVDIAIEVCDGTPSYVETHQSGFPVYCPWGGRIISEK